MVICEHELEVYEATMEATDRAYIALDAALSNEMRAAIALPSAYASLVPCTALVLSGGLTPAGVACEIAAAAAIAAAEVWLDTAETAAALTTQVHEHAVDLESRAYDAFVECCSDYHAGQSDSEGVIETYDAELEALNQQIDEAESEILYSEGLEEEVQNLIDEAEEAGEVDEEESDEDLMA